MAHIHMMKNPNTLGLKFTDAGWIENFVLNEIEKDYHFETLGLGPADLVIDIGAHTGVVAMYIVKKWGCRVKSYEPALRNYKLLVQNIELNGLGHRIDAYNFAVTCDGRDVLIGDNPINWGGNNIYSGNGLKVASVTLAQIITSPVALLKVDAERAEFEIFNDLEPLKWVKSIRGEFHGSKGRDMYKLLQHVQSAVPDTKPMMHKNWEMREAEREAANKKRLQEKGVTKNAS